MLGIDIVEIARIEKAVNSASFFKKVYSADEIEYYNSNGKRAQTLAGFWAAKEAVIKALGAEVRGLELNKISVGHTSEGKPFVTFIEAGTLSESTTPQVEISISHSDNYAVAVALKVGNGCVKI